jgi:glutathione S-transferase
MATTQKVTLAYWEIRGLVEPIRTLLEHLEVPYEMENYTTDGQWLAKKTDKSMTFPNLPYLADGEKYVTESDAIIAHVCIKGNNRELLGKPEDTVEYTLLRGVIRDILSGIVDSFYTTNTKEELKSTVDTFMSQSGSYKFSGLNQILENREWVLGYLTTLDFILAELVEKFGDLDKDVGTKILADYPNLQAHLKRFLELPRIKAYRSSERFRARPYHDTPVFG